MDSVIFLYGSWIIKTKKNDLRYIPTGFFLCRAASGYNSSVLLLPHEYKISLHSLLLILQEPWLLLSSTKDSCRYKYMESLPGLKAQSSQKLYFSYRCGLMDSVTCWLFIPFGYSDDKGSRLYLPVLFLSGSIEAFLLATRCFQSPVAFPVDE